MRSKSKTNEKRKGARQECIKIRLQERSSIMTKDIQEQSALQFNDLETESDDSNVTEPKPSTDIRTELTEVQNANIFVDLFQDKLRYASGLGWLMYVGTHWQKCEEQQQVYLAREVVDYWIKRAGKCTNSNDLDKINSWIKTTQSSKGIDNLLKLAQSDPKIQVKQESLDNQKLYLNLANGTYNLSTGKLQKHNPDDLITKCLNVSYDEDAECQNWIRFQNEISNNDQDLIKYKQKMYGYALSGGTEAQVFFVLQGSGANGKSTELSVVGDILNDYAGTINTDALMGSSSVATLSALAQIKGKRFVVASESNDNSVLNEAVIKTATGGEKISAKLYYKDSFDFYPEFKLFISTNYKPEIKGTDEGIWRRLKLIPYTVTIPPEKRNPNLKEDLSEEAQGILNWLLEGYALYRQEGLGACPAVEAATNHYRTEQDIIKQFIDDNCIQKPSEQILSTIFYDVYKGWCASVGENPITKNKFGRRLTELGYEKTKTRRGNEYIGLSLNTNIPALSLN